jgi:hypothetical protein
MKKHNKKASIACGIPRMANGGANPYMLGTGMARDAGIALATRGNRIESALDDATGSQTQTISAPAGKGGMSRIRDGATPPAEMLEAQRRGMKDGGMKRGNAAKIERGHGGKVYGPGGKTDDKVGPVALSNGEYVLPADTVQAMGGQKALDAIRAKTHKFVDPKNKPAIMRGMADGGQTDKKKPWVSDFYKPASTIPTLGEAMFGTAPPSQPVGQNIGAASRVVANVASGTGEAIGNAARSLENTRQAALSIANNIPGAIAAPIANAADSFGADIRTGYTGQKYVGREFVGKPLFGDSGNAAAQPSIAGQSSPNNKAVQAQPVVQAAQSGNVAAAPSVVPSTTATSAEATLPASVRAPDGTLNSKALADSTFTANNDALLAEQAGRFAQKFNDAQGDTKFNDPAAAETFYKNRTASELSPQMVDIVNKGIRARQNTSQSVAADNARFAMDGYGGVTKSVGKDGRVSYGDSTPNPYIASKFSNGKTGAQIMAERQASDAANLKNGQAQAAQDKASLDSIYMDGMRNAALSGNSNAALVLNNQSTNASNLEATKLKIAADLTPKPLNAYDQERTRGAKLENDRSATQDKLLAEFMNAKDDKTRESLLSQLNAARGTNYDKYILAEIESGVDALGNPIKLKVPFNTRTGQYVGMNGGTQAGGMSVTKEQVDAAAKAKGITDPAQIKSLYAIYGVQ